MDLNQDQSNIVRCLPRADQEIPAEINDYFDLLRQTGDELADKLVKETLAPHDKFKQRRQQGYNHLLDIADILAESPALALNSNTIVAKEFNEYPEELRNYFEPIKAPEWIDEEKLALANKLWQQDMLAVLTVLYSISLPSCYLMKNGIPALYDTAKLADRKYIYQRIYETGLMLDAVLGPDGMQIFTDLDHTQDEHVRDSLNKNDPLGKWEWQGNILMRTAAKDSTDSENLSRQVQNAIDDNPEKSTRYLWGKGFITARKVRFLHAAMRFMLMNPDEMGKARDAKPKNANFVESIQHIPKPYDSAALGAPVNQEDQAYTLLTFAYCIPKGLEKLGRYWSIEEKEAFLHTWKVVGHTMGIQDNLMADDWEQAEKLFSFIQRRQIGESEQAKHLTKTIVYFFQDYLPDYFGWSRGLATRLITDQLGKTQAKMILPKDYIDESNKPGVAFAFSVVMTVLWLFYRSGRIIYKIPFVAKLFRGVFYNAGIDFVQSWRDIYSRKPFYVPMTVNTWKREKGVNEAFQKQLTTWRRELFNTMILGLGCVIGSGLSFLLFLLFSLFGAGGIAGVLGWISATLVLVGIFVLQNSLAKVSERRPKIKHQQSVPR